MWKILYGINPGDVKPVDDIVYFTPRPVLVLYSKTDEMIPVCHAQRLAEAIPHAQLAFFDKFSHTEIFRDNTEDYLAVLLPLLSKEW